MKRVLIFLISFGLGIGVLLLAIGRQGFVSPLRSVEPELEPTTDSRSILQTGGPTTMKGFSYQTTVDVAQSDGHVERVRDYSIKLGSAELNVGPGLNDLTNPGPSLSQDPELIVYNRKPVPEERELARIKARFGRTTPADRQDDAPQGEARVKSVEFEQDVRATIFDPDGNNLQLDTERLLVTQVSSDPNKPRFEATASQPIKLTKPDGSLTILAAGLNLDLERGFLTLHPPVHVEGVDFALPSVGLTRAHTAKPSESKPAELPITIDCKGGAVFRRVEDPEHHAQGSSDVRFALNGGHLAFNDDVMVRRGTDWLHCDKLKLWFARDPKNPQSLRAERCIASGVSAPVSFRMRDYDGECREIRWAVDNPETVLDGPCQIAGTSLSALPGATATTEQPGRAVLRAQRQVVVHSDANGGSKLTLFGQARLTDSADRPLLQGDTIDLEFAQPPSPDEHKDDRTADLSRITADENAGLDFAGTHVEGRHVLLEKDAASASWRINVSELRQAQVQLPAQGEETTGGQVILAPLDPQSCTLHGDERLVIVEGRCELRQPLPGSSAWRRLTADRLELPNPGADKESAALPLIAVGKVVLIDPAQDLELTCDRLSLPSQPDAEPLVAAGQPAVLHARVDDQKISLWAPVIKINPNSGLVAEGGAELRMPAKLLAGTVQIGADISAQADQGEAVLRCQQLTLSGEQSNGPFHPVRLLAEHDVDLTNPTQGMSAQGETLDLDLVQQTGQLVGRESCLAEINKRTSDGAPLLTMRAPLILIEDSGKALKAPRLGVVFFWSKEEQGQLSSTQDLTLRENRVTAREDVRVFMRQRPSGSGGHEVRSAKDYSVRADAADADLTRTNGELVVERVIASGSVRFASGSLRGRCDRLTMEQAQQSMFAEGRGRPCVFEQNGREMVARTFFYSRSTGQLRAQDLLLGGLSP